MDTNCDRAAACLVASGVCMHLHAVVSRLEFCCPPL